MKKFCLPNSGILAKINDNSDVVGDTKDSIVSATIISLNKRLAPDFRLGDIIYFQKGCGDNIKINGDNHILLHAHSVIFCEREEAEE